MLGAVLTRVDDNGERMIFFAEDGREFHFYHSQNCCESVRVEDVCGDLTDLVGSPILVAEEVSNEDQPPPEHADSYTWTFYRYATAKGHVTVRWLGESNGYYSESVEFHVEEPRVCDAHEDCLAHKELARACYVATQRHSDAQAASSGSVPPSTGPR